MSDVIPAGPFATLRTPEGIEFPFYVIRYDKDGKCESPETLEDLISKCRDRTDIFVCSHGWNNDWTTATERYQEFIHGYQLLRKGMNLPAPTDFRPLIVGVFWPSQAMEWFESETGPKIAGIEAPIAASDLFGDVAAALAPAERARLRELSEKQKLSPGEALEFASLLAGQAATDREAHLAAPDGSDLVAAAKEFDAAGRQTPQTGSSQVGSLDEDEDSDEPQAALGLGGIAQALDPRNIWKPFTMWQMKDRAGVVGSVGVEELLRRLLTTSQARVHLLGHSYGCKVVMSAVCKLPEETRKVHSAVLFQPAVSQYAFASAIPERPGMVGGFRIAFDRVVAPILATYSEYDVPLTKLFHLAARRQLDLGEEPRAAAKTAPSIYAALGGFGPGGTDGSERISIGDAGDPYNLAGGERLIALNGSRTISGHGDIVNQSTYWLAYVASMYR